MSWVELPQLDCAPAKLASPVTVRASKPGRYRPRLTVTVRPSCLPGLSWWTHEAMVHVQIGQGEHAGRLRIAPGDNSHGNRRLSGMTGRGTVAGKPTPAALTITTFPGLPSSGYGPEEPAWELLGDALIVTLPWADAKGAVKAPPSPQAPALKPPAPAVSATPRPAANTMPAIPGLKALCAPVLRLLRERGGKCRLDSLTHSQIRTLRLAEDAGWANWGVSGGWWSITARGEAMLATGAT